MTLQNRISTSVYLQSKLLFLHTVDVACAMLALWFEECDRVGNGPKVVVHTFDLKSAYRQLALSSHGKRFSCSEGYLTPHNDA